MNRIFTLALTLCLSVINVQSQSSKLECKKDIRDRYYKAVKLSYKDPVSALTKADSLAKDLELCFDTSLYVNIKLLQSTSFSYLEKPEQADSIIVQIDVFFSKARKSNAYYLYLFRKAADLHVKDELSAARDMYMKISQEVDTSFSNIFMFETKLLQNWASAERDLGNRDKAIDLLEKSIENTRRYEGVQSEFNIKKSYSTAYNSLGILMKRIKDFEKANYYYRKSMALFPKDHGYHHTAVSNYLEVLTQQDSISKVSRLCEEYLGFVKGVTNRSYFYYHGVRAYLFQDKIDKAGSILQKYKSEFPYSENLSSRVLNNLLDADGDYNLKIGDVQKARQLYKKRLDLISKNESKATYATAIKDITSTFITDLEGREYFEELIDIKDSLLLASVDNEVKKWETKFYTKEKELENIQLVNKNQIVESKVRQRNIFIVLLTAGLLSLIFGLYTAIKRSKEKTRFLDELSKRNLKIESLNKEISHRTKNYLNLASSLLTKDKTSSSDINTQNVLEENAQRIKILSSINQRLSSNSEQNTISLRDFLSNVLEDLSFTFAHINGKKLKIDYLIEDVEIDSDICLYLGLMTNELVVNSIKHANVEDLLRININVNLDNEKVQFLYKDNGIENETSRTPFGGYQLIEDLMRQLQGVKKQSFDNGYKLEGSFPYKMEVVH